MDVICKMCKDLDICREMCRKKDKELAMHIKMCEEKNKEIESLKQQLKKMKAALMLSRGAFSQCRRNSMVRPSIPAPAPPAQESNGPRVKWIQNSMGKWIPEIPDVPMTRPPGSKMPFNPFIVKKSRKSNHAKYKNVRY